MDQFNDIPWKIISMYFRDNPTALIDHHLVSYNAFFDKGIKQVLKEKNPIRFIKDQHEKSKDFPRFIGRVERSAPIIRDRDI